jgi:FAD:protein FMN transferase
MESFQFKALGTAWSLSVDAPIVPEAVWQSIVAETADFEQHFSRFIEGSEVTIYRHAKAGEYKISLCLTELLSAADRLRNLTDGAYNPAVGGLLEAAGYNSRYELKPDPQKIAEWSLQVWTLDEPNRSLTIAGPLIFDLGGIGKGYWIDQVSLLLKKAGYPNHLVEGGGDMMATQKADGQAWRVAVEWPGKPDTALGLVELKNQGLAVSDNVKRKWGAWHHLVDVAVKQPVNHILGCVAVAPSAWQADQLTSALALQKSEKYSEMAKILGGEYVVLLANEQALVSADWNGELF